MELLPVRASDSFEPALARLDGAPGNFIAALDSPARFSELILSGSIGRWEVIKPPLGVSPGEGPEPDFQHPEIETAPVVGVIDGGYHANSYRYAIAWEADKLVSDIDADKRHGNIIIGLIADAVRWSNVLQIPDFPCRVGVAQAVQRRDRYVTPVTAEDLSNYLAKVMEEHPETLV